MGGGYWYDISTHYTLVTGNINEIGTMYANRHGNNPLVGPEADAPRFHANWVNTPHSLGEATRMSTVVVVATARGAEEGEPLVFAPEHGVAPIPTQRVTFDVVRPYKGDLVAGESFVLFQNGNDASRFEEDPTYKPGHRYLLFLTQREDGTFLVVAPEGRYEITRNGLVPAAEKGFAFDLKGANLQDVLSDVRNALVVNPGLE
jgi:hypothetical protein